MSVPLPAAARIWTVPAAPAGVSDSFQVSVPREPLVERLPANVPLPVPLSAAETL